MIQEMEREREEQQFEKKIKNKFRKWNPYKEINLNTIREYIIENKDSTFLEYMVLKAIYSKKNK